jgi:hypothetical protein
MKRRRRSANGSKEEEGFTSQSAVWTMPELEAIAQNAISRFIVLASQRITQRPDEPGSQKLSMLLLG